MPFGEPLSDTAGPWKLCNRHLTMETMSLNPRTKLGLIETCLEVILVPYPPTLDAFCIKIPSNQCRNDSGCCEVFSRRGRSTSGLGQIIAVCPGDALDHADVEESGQLPGPPG